MSGATDPTTSAAVNCDDCALAAPRRTDPIVVLERMPESLIARDRPAIDSAAPLLTTDIMQDDTVFGPLGDDNVSLQWEIARIVTGEKDEWLAGWKRAEALTLGAGRMSVVAGRLVTQCPHANGSDLDLVGAQYGIGRPTGFTDGCYWRLIVLALFKPGNRVWLLQEISALYTGERPMVTEDPAKVRLKWQQQPPSPEADFGMSFFSSADAPSMPSDTFFSNNAFFVGEQGDAPSDGDGFWMSSTDPARDTDAFWQTGGSTPSGLGLIQALGFVVPAGVAVELVDMPLLGLAGCYGATMRGALESAGSAFFAQGQ